MSENAPRMPTIPMRQQLPVGGRHESIVYWTLKVFDEVIDPNEGKIVFT